MEFPDAGIRCSLKDCKKLAQSILTEPLIIVRRLSQGYFVYSLCDLSIRTAPSSSSVPNPVKEIEASREDFFNKLESKKNDKKSLAKSDKISELLEKIKSKKPATPLRKPLERTNTDLGDNQVPESLRLYFVITLNTQDKAKPTPVFVSKKVVIGRALDSWMRFFKRNDSENMVLKLKESSRTLNLGLTFEAQMKTEPLLVNFAGLLISNK
ncbi:hypothetical protein BB560_000212 [Smittium megazygosporum]|uniref:Uncharacterized protein n=1 Tax=Smittium megazygosporum TaxID=133381 RepID=A0A2T9ZL37_9FUNG|nr:hypothetical protein BB560_000212 [Smittium megazygosporum]